MKSRGGDRLRKSPRSERRLNQLKKIEKKRPFFSQSTGIRNEQDCRVSQE
jgi:hypothetical protein